MTSSIIPPSKRAEYVGALINQPWTRDGRHCWRLVREIERDLFGRDLPHVLDVAPTGGAGLRERARLFAGHEERAYWREVDLPDDGAVGLMHRSGGSPDMLIHAGVFLKLDRNGVVHCDDPCGVVFESFMELRARLWVPRWFIPRD